MIIENDDFFADIPVNTEDQVENEASEENVIENENIVDKILEQENNPKTPVKDHANVVNKTPETICAIPNTPESLNRKRSFSRAFRNDDVKNKMSKGWLAKVVEDPSASFVGYLQIFSSKNIEVKGKPLTLFKASDGQYVTWNVALDPNISHIVPAESVIEVTKASIEQGFRLVIQDYVLVAENVEEELILDDELVFLEKSWYVDLFNRKGMLNKKGARNFEHPHFQTTPLKMVTRSKAAKLDVGGIRCDRCGKMFKNQKNMEQHLRRYH